MSEWTPERDERWLRKAIDLSRLCPPSPSAFSVGAIIVSSDDEIISQSYSRESDPRDHAEEGALAKTNRADPRLAAATSYCSLEPCSQRASRLRSCTELTITAGIPRVVIAWREPAILVDCEGVELLEAAGIEVVEIPALADIASQVNQHLMR
jgi:pyrimidine deaminase RibD-like protein